MWNLTRRVSAGLLVAILCGCGSGHDGTQTTSSAKHLAKKPVNAALALQQSLVSGVTQVKPGNKPLPIEVKFGLREKPDVAQPLDVDIRITPTSANVDRVFGKVEGEDGLELIGPGELTEADKPLENTPIDRSIKVLPKKDGIYTLTATVSVDTAGQVSTQAYSFPVIAGAGAPDLPAKPATAATTTANAATPPASR
jgi:hypothetical protein